MYTGAGMYPQMVYHADVRARELQLAAERQMGCSCAPLGRMISRVITKCNGRQGRVRYDEKMDYSMAYAPAQTCYVRPTPSARTVTLATTSNHHPPHAHAVQPEPPRAHATTMLPATPFPSTGALPHGAHKPKKKKKKKKHVRFTQPGPVPADEPPPHAQQHTATSASGGGAAATASVVYHQGTAEPPQPPYYPAAPPASHGGQGGHGYSYGYGRYAPSPLPRWEVLGTPRRHEYFSGEYRWYYPTPVREGIYSIATDANGRLSTIFSEENPNACTIV